MPQAQVLYRREARSEGPSILETLGGSSNRVSHDVNHEEEGFCNRWRSLWRSWPPRSNLCPIRRWSTAWKLGYKNLAPISALSRDLRFVWVTHSGGGDPEGLDERSAHPKPRRALDNLGMTMEVSRLKEINMKLKKEIPESSKVKENLAPEGWAMEIYKGEVLGEEKWEEDDGVLELDLEEEETEATSKFLAIGVFFSQKSYSPHILFQDMCTAWGINELPTIDKIGDYCFKMEFASEKDKVRVTEGGP
jgi:hypothetical protein